MKIRSKTRGSFTVEAALVVPVILLVLFILIYSSMLVYQWVLLTKAASFAAQQGAEIWTDSRRDIDSGAWNPMLAEDSLYYRIFDDSLFGTDFNTFHNPYKETLFFPEYNDKAEDAALQDAVAGSKNIQDKKVARMRNAVYRSLSKGLLKPASTELTIEYENVLVQRKLEITISQQYRLPFGNIFALLGRKPLMTLKGRGAAVVAEPAEYIRNVDLGIEYIYRTKSAFDLDEKIKGLADKIKGK